ncbi:MAG: hypothetical protein GYB53_23625 [Rhodobacteraceae bacterium]|nr:hypothetical protein [Paracoccaceae bacterium]MBR9821807.1 hypothetical protein [Paracoccaceae bacterium]
MTQALSLSFGPRRDASEITVQVARGDTPLFSVAFRARTGQSLREAPEALLCLGLFAASELGTALQIDGAPAPELLARAGEITDHFVTWWPGCRPVTVRTSGTAAPRAPVPGTGLFYSGGVDSSFSLIEARDRVTALITLLGVDVPLSDTVESAAMEARTRALADKRGLEAIIIETDLRQKFHPFAGWIEMHGGALAAIGHMLSEHFGELLIAASSDLGDFTPWGSHPHLDPLFSAPALEVVHHRPHPRVEKIARVAEEGSMLPELRVCTQTSVNCGRCPKCNFVLRTLDILGDRARATSFPDIDPVQTPLWVSYLRHLDEAAMMRAMAERAGRDDHVAAIDAGVVAYHRRTGGPLKALQGWLKPRQRIWRHRARWRRARP